MREGKLLKMVDPHPPAHWLLNSRGIYHKKKEGVLGTGGFPRSPLVGENIVPRRWTSPKVWRAKKKGAHGFKSTFFAEGKKTGVPSDWTGLRHL